MRKNKQTSWKSSWNLCFRLFTVFLIPRSWISKYLNKGSQRSRIFTNEQSVNYSQNRATSDPEFWKIYSFWLFLMLFFNLRCRPPYNWRSIFETFDGHFWTLDVILKKWCIFGLMTVILKIGRRPANKWEETPNDPLWIVWIRRFL